MIGSGSDSKLIYDPNPAATTALDVANYPVWSSRRSIYNPGADGYLWWPGVGMHHAEHRAGSLPRALIPYWLQIGDYPNWNAVRPNYNNGDVVTYDSQLWRRRRSQHWLAAVPSRPAARTGWSPSNPYYGVWTTMSSYYPAPTIYRWPIRTF